MSKITRIVLTALFAVTVVTIALSPVAYAGGDGGEDPPVQTDVNWNS